MAGGWDAGGAKIPKLAMVDIASSGSGSSKNSYGVIAGYLLKAGLTNNINTPWPLGGTSAVGNHGQIYDRLTMEDFQPSTPGDWTTSTFYKNSFWGRRAVDPNATDGYTALWVPHWIAPGSCATCSRNGTPISCSDCGLSCTCATTYPQATVNAALFVIGRFQIQGGDLFAECAGLGSFDGAQSTSSGASTYSPAGIVQTDTHFQTDAAPGPYGFLLDINTTPTAASFLGSYSNPLMQLGDFEFVPQSGAITSYKATDYRATVVRLITETPATDQ
jgi:hypothetical protein